MMPADLTSGDDIGAPDIECRIVAESTGPSPLLIPNPRNLADLITNELHDIATTAKAGTEHEDHDGWQFLADRVLRCRCGHVLADPKEARP